MTQGPPPRLLDDPNAPAALRDDLAEAGRSRGVYDTAAGLAALKLAIDAAAPASAAASATKAAAGAKGTGLLAKLAALPATAKLAMLLGVLGGVGVGSRLVWGTAPSARTATEAQQDAQPTDSAPLAEPAIAPPLAEAAKAPQPAETLPGQGTSAMEPPSTAALDEADSSPVLDTPGPRARSNDHRARKPRARPGAQREAALSPEVALRREVQQLARIKRLLPRDPATAFALAEAGHRRFEGGMLEHEREALAIVALVSLKRHAEADRRAQRFFKRFPDSPMRARIEGVLMQARDRKERLP